MESLGRRGALTATWHRCGTSYSPMASAIIAPSPEHAAAGGDYLVFGMMPVAVIFAASALTLVIVSLGTQPPSKETVDKFFMRREA